MITLTQLEYIVAVERLGNFGQAAKSCFVTQPTLSMQIQKLEHDLGVLIFDRRNLGRDPILDADLRRGFGLVANEHAR